MTIYRVASTGSNTAPYDTWAKASTSFATALAAATVTGDEVWIDTANVPAADKEVSADTTWTFAASIRVICGTQSGSADLTPASMGGATWLGNSTTNRSITLNGGFKVYIFGLTLRTAGSTADNILIGGASDDIHYEFEEPYFWHGNTIASSFLRLGPAASNSANAYIKLISPIFHAAHASHIIRCAANLEIINGLHVGTPPTVALFGCSDSSDSGGGRVVVIAGEYGNAGAAPLVGDITRPAQQFEFIQCKLGSGYQMLATQTVTNKSGAQVWVRDCASGDTHGQFGYADALGSVFSDTDIYYTGSPAGQSWRIETTANASIRTPFVTPWLSRYVAGGVGSITPRLEILRDGSSPAFQDDEIWCEATVKRVPGSTVGIYSMSRMAVLGTPANVPTGDGTSAWTGNGTSWSGQLNVGAVSPAEDGMVGMRVVVGAPSAVVYVDPVIRY